MSDADPHLLHGFAGHAGVAEVAWARAADPALPGTGCRLVWGPLRGHVADPAAADHPALLTLMAAAVPDAARRGGCLVVARSAGPDEAPCWWAFVMTDGETAPESLHRLGRAEDLARHVLSETAGGGIDCLALSPEAIPALEEAGLPVHALDPDLIDPEVLPVFAAASSPTPGRTRRRALMAGAAVLLPVLAWGLWQGVLRAPEAPVPPPMPEIAHVRDPAQFAVACAAALARPDWPHAPGWKVAARGCHDARALPVAELDGFGLETAAFTIYRRDANWAPGLALGLLDIVLADTPGVLTRMEGTEVLVAAWPFTAPMVPLAGPVPEAHGHPGPGLEADLHRAFAGLAPETGPVLEDGADAETEAATGVSGPDGAGGEILLRVTATPAEALARAALLEGAGLLSFRTLGPFTTEARFGPPVTAGLPADLPADLAGPADLSVDIPAAAPEDGS